MKASICLRKVSLLVTSKSRKVDCSNLSFATTPPEKNCIWLLFTKIIKRGPLAILVNLLPRVNRKNIINQLSGNLNPPHEFPGRGRGCDSFLSIPYNINCYVSIFKAYAHCAVVGDSKQVKKCILHRRLCQVFSPFPLLGFGD